MPYGDRTGPEGFGPGTGRRAGLCSGYAAPGYMNDEVPRRGHGGGMMARGRRMGFRGHGRGHRFPAEHPATEANELSYLKYALARINDNARTIMERIEVLESEPGTTGTE